MAKTRVFISFDADHDAILKDFVVGQAKNEDSPFEITDYSVKKELSGDWEKKVKDKMSNTGVEQMIVICGENTNTASGVDVEISIANSLNIPYFLLNGYSDTNGVKPKAAKSTDIIYKWTWDNLKLLLNGSR